MKVGDYVRTKKGYIAKIVRFNSTGSIVCDSKVYESYNVTGLTNKILKNLSQITKSSPNIIDLIEVGDLVYVDISPDDCGGIIVPRITETENELNSLKLLIENKNYILKSIITHEQIESIEYKVKE